MSTAERAVVKREFYPGLEGLRGYAILIVFVTHYLGPGILPTHGSPVLTILERGLSAFWFVVPVFFVISGLLITDILLETRTKEGYFKAFYSRRLLTICPAYYMTLLTLAVFHAWQGKSIDPRFWTNFLFVQNLVPGYLFSHTVPATNEMGHLWFIAAIVQFYVLWPLVVWFFPDRRQLLRIAGTLIAFICLIRIASPCLHLSVSDTYVSTATRADAILLGVVISLSRHNASYKKLEAWAGFAAVIAIGAMISLSLWTGSAWPRTYRRVAVIHPVANLVGALVVMAVIIPNSRFERACSLAWARNLGKISFAFYVFHYTYSKWFFRSLTPRLATFMPLKQALTISALVAFILSVGLALLDRKFLERPTEHLKARLTYGRHRTIRKLSA